MRMSYRIDTQGLLDRVFPLPASSAESSSSQPTFYSFRTLLKESSQHSLCELRVSYPQKLLIFLFSHCQPSLLYSISSRSPSIHALALQRLQHSSSSFATLLCLSLTRLPSIRSPFPWTSKPSSHFPYKQPTRMPTKRQNRNLTSDPFHVKPLNHLK